LAERKQYFRVIFSVVDNKILDLARTASARKGLRMKEDWTNLITPKKSVSLLALGLVPDFK
jgi:hypothetical protein